MGERWRYLVAIRNLTNCDLRFSNQIVGASRIMVINPQEEGGIGSFDLADSNHKGFPNRVAILLHDVSAVDALLALLNHKEGVRFSETSHVFLLQSLSDNLCFFIFYFFQMKRL